MQRVIEPAAAVPLGAGVAWRSVATTGHSTLALDDTGQVWRWSTFPGASRVAEGRDWSEPHLVAERNDWVRLHGRMPPWGAGERADGSVWAFVLSPEVKQREPIVQPAIRLEKPMVTLVGSPRFDIAGCADGTLWGWRRSDIDQTLMSNRPYPERYNVLPARRLSRRTDWVAFSSQGWALTGDGVVWKWPEDVHPLLGPPWRMQPVLTLPVNPAE